MRMKIMLDTTDLDVAVRMYLKSKGFEAEGTTFRGSEPDEDNGPCEVECEADVTTIRTPDPQR
jgi:hypothetical protein